jgi:hypothetical protein
MRIRPSRILAWTTIVGGVCWAVGVIAGSALYGVVSLVPRLQPRAGAELVQWIWFAGYALTLGSVAVLLADHLRRQLLGDQRASRER